MPYSHEAFSAGHLAHYHEEDPSIEISEKALANRDLLLYLLLHELGHWYRWESLGDRWPTKNYEDEEDFAHAFASYLKSPKKFAEEDSIWAFAIDDVVPQEHQKAVLYWASRKLDKLR